MFEDARLKLKRADKHITDLQARIASLPDFDVATIEIYPQGGNEVIKHDIQDRTALSDLALIAGDAVHNLKCALDYTWLETITRAVPSAVGKFAKFPIYPSRDGLEAALRGNEVDIIHPGLFRLILDEIKPYDGGNSAIWPVHRYDIRDKHRLLIPVIFYSSISGIETENEAGEISTGGYSLGTTQQPPYYIPIPFGLHVKNKGKVSIDVMFEYVVSGNRFRVIDAFPFYSRLIFQIVETFEAFLET